MATGGYLAPPQEIVDIPDAPLTPGVLVGPTRDVFVLMERRSIPLTGWQGRPLGAVGQLPDRPAGGVAEALSSSGCGLALARAHRLSPARQGCSTSLRA